MSVEIVNMDMCQVKIQVTDPRAVVPSRVRDTDVGFDLTLIEKVKQWNSLTCLYDTGIKVGVPDGYYTEIFPRSSLSKSGYMLANSIGVIDPEYRGNIYVALTKVDPTAPDIELPFKGCQLVVRRQERVRVVVVEALDETSRGEGGFGSTGA